MYPALVCKFPVSTEYGSKEQLEVLCEVCMRKVQQLVHHVEQMKEQAALDQDQLHQQPVLLNTEKEPAVLQNTQSMKHLSR
jgi:hypothetical protein